MMKTAILSIFLHAIVTVVLGQKDKKNTIDEDTATFRVRGIVVMMDTTFEDKTDHFRPDKGIKIVSTTNIFRVWSFAEYRNKNLNGIYMNFYLETNMPQERGKYHNNEKDGEWFYWSPDGKLTRKEVWSEGKLIKKLIM